MYNNALYMYNSALYSTMDRALYMDNSSHTGYVGCCTRENSTLYKGDNRLPVSVNKCAASGPVSSGPKHPLDLVSSSVAFSYSGLSLLLVLYVGLHNRGVPRMVLTALLYKEL